MSINDSIVNFDFLLCLSGQNYTRAMREVLCRWAKYVVENVELFAKPLPKNFYSHSNEIN